MTNIVESLLNRLNSPRPDMTTIHIDGKLEEILFRIAQQENKPVEEKTLELLQFAVSHYLAVNEKLQLWEALTAREQQIAALTCLNHTNHDISELLTISVNTVKTHLRNIFDKCQLSSKEELRQVLAGIDFSDWLTSQDLPPDDAPTPIFPASPPEANP